MNLVFRVGLGLVFSGRGLEGRGLVNIAGMWSNEYRSSVCVSLRG